MNKIIVFLLLIMSSTVFAQDYVDLIKVNYGSVLNAGYENNAAETNVNLFDVATTFPIKLNENFAIITGLDLNSQNLEVFANTDDINLTSLSFKAGVALKHSEKWSGTYLLLPKIASQDLEFNNQSFFVGGLVLMKYQKRSNMQYRFGVYATSEGFGTLVTPILGLYYQSENKYWEATMNLPINGDVNYSLNEVSKLGLGFQAPVRSYTLAQDTNGDSNYVQANLIEVGPYLEHSFAKQRILLRFQVGYSSVDYQAFAEGDELPFRLAAFEFGDDRNRLNPEMNGNIFLRIGATYRFHITNN